MSEQQLREQLARAEALIENLQAERTAPRKCDRCAGVCVKRQELCPACESRPYEQLASCHEAMGAARAVLHELDASGNYPHSSVAIGVVLMALEKALK